MRSAVRGLAFAGFLVAALTCSVAVEASGRPGTSVEFHGWSPDSQYVAYTRSKRAAGAKSRRKPRLTRRSYHRRVKDGRFKGTGPIGEDTHIPRYAERKGYIVPDLDRLEVSDTETWFVGLEGTYKLRLTVGEVLAWELSFEEHVIERRVFDTIYVHCSARLYPSPNRSHALLVMHLNRGWTTDAAVYPLTLPGPVGVAWERIQGR